MNKIGVYREFQEIRNFYENRFLYLEKLLMHGWEKFIKEADTEINFLATAPGAGRKQASRIIYYYSENVCVPLCAKLFLRLQYER